MDFLGEIGLRLQLLGNCAWRSSAGQRRVERMSKHCTNPRGNIRRFGQATGAEFAAGHAAFVRIHDRHTVGAQLLQIPLRRWVIPHPHIHGRNRQHRLIRSEQYRRRQIVGNSRRHLGKNIRSRRADNNQVGLAT